MKKLIALSLVFGVTIVGCEGTQQTTKAPEKPTEATATEAVVPTSPAAVAPLSGAAICQLSGAAGAVVSCPVRLAAVPDTVAARALQLTLGYDSARATFIGLFDAGAAERRLTAEEPVVARTGHSVLQSPDQPEAWAGKGSLVIAHFTSPTTPITQAVLRSGAVEGDAVVATARFRLSGEAPASSPVVVTATALVAADQDAAAVPARTEAGVIVTGGAR
ncbi:MAG: hypothetical protein AMXMBFR64_00690 [Myxococcales bacterium]